MLTHLWMVCKYTKVSAIYFLRGWNISNGHDIFPFVRISNYFLHLLEMTREIDNHPATKRTLLLLLGEKSSFET